MANKDAFEGKNLGALTGLDQRLFGERAIETTKQRNNDTTRPRSDQYPSRPDIGQASQRANETTDDAANVTSAGRTAEPAREVRIPERHSHDIFRDQVRWMNRVKLELEEAHGKRITSNALVQLAIDLIRLDHEKNGRSSRLVRVLIGGAEPQQVDTA